MASQSSTDTPLAELLKSNGLPDDVLVELNKSPYKITTVKQFANYFETKAEVQSLFIVKIPKLKEEGDIIANLKQAWREAEACVCRSVKRAADRIPEEDLEDPLRPKCDTSSD